MKFRSVRTFQPYEKEGYGFFNTVLTKLPFEIHFPGYNFLGPGTQLEKRLCRGDRPVNLLDAAALQHDLAYSRHKNLNQRHIADEILEKAAWKRATSKNVPLSERAVSLLTSAAMKMKRKIGMGGRRKKRSAAGFRKKKQKGGRRRKIKFGRGRRKKQRLSSSSFSKLLHTTRNVVKKNKNTNLENAADTALGVVQHTLKQKKFKLPRIISPIPRKGGAISLVPILASLSALGGAANSASNVVKLVKDVVNAKRTLFPGQKKKIASGIYLAPYKKRGFGLMIKNRKN